MKFLMFAIALLFFFKIHAQNKLEVDSVFLKSGDVLIGKIEASDKKYIYFKRNNGQDLRIKKEVVTDSKSIVFEKEKKAPQPVDLNNVTDMAGGFFIVGGIGSMAGLTMITVGLLNPKETFTNITVPGTGLFPAQNVRVPTQEINKPLIYGGLGVFGLASFFNILGGVNLMSNGKKIRSSSNAYIEYDYYGTSASVRLRF